MGKSIDANAIITILEVLGGVLTAINGTINAIERMKEGKTITNEDLLEIRKTLMQLPDLQEILEAVKRGETIEFMKNEEINESEAKIQ